MYEIDEEIKNKNLNYKDLMFNFKEINEFKNFCSIVIDPIIIRLHGISGMKEIYIEKRRFEILKNSLVYAILNIQISNKLKDLPFDLENEKIIAREKGIDHSEYSRIFTESLQDRIGLLLTPEVQLLIDNTYSECEYVDYLMNDK